MRHSPEYLRACFDYDAETGGLLWKERPLSHFRCWKDQHSFNRQRVGTPALASLNQDGYRKGTLNGKTYRQHRVIFAMVEDRWPTEQIDHRNSDPADNRWSNLRAASVEENNRNRRLWKRQQTGFKGVHLSNPTYGTSKYKATIYLDGNVRYLGSFATPEEAHAAYCAAAVERFGEFARAG